MIGTQRDDPNLPPWQVVLLDQLPFAEFRISNNDARLPRRVTVQNSIAPHKTSGTPVRMRLEKNVMYRDNFRSRGPWRADVLRVQDVKTQRDLANGCFEGNPYPRRVEQPPATRPRTIWHEFLRRRLVTANQYQLSILVGRHHEF